MKTLKEFLKKLGRKVNQNEVESYYGHGTHKHKTAGNLHQDNKESILSNKFVCPMKCEDKVYDEPGNCPECNMKLVPVNGKSSHNHHKHNHGCC